MLIIKDLHGNVEGLTDYKDLEINEEVNGDFSLSCQFINSENNSHAWDLIVEESIIEHEGHEYRIKKIAKEIYRKQIHAPHVFFDLIDHQVYDIQGGTMYPENAFAFILSGTGWTFEVVDSIPPQLLFNFGEDNALSLIRKACEAFNCEVKIEPNRHLKIYQQIGKDDDYQFRYKHNIKAIKENVDTTKLATVIRGYGGNNLQVTYTSPNVSVFGERHAEPVRDDDIIEASTMIERLKRELVDTPEASIELEAILLEGAELGDTIWLIHEKLGIEFQTRIMAKKSKPKTPSADTVTLGNRKQTLSDLLTETKIEINENAKQFRSKIEQTNDRITMEVESVNESIATLEIKADNIQLGVTELNGRMGNAESQLSIQAGQIQSKVSYSEYNGPTVTSMITQDPYSISLMAQNLNMQGLVTFTNLSTQGQTRIDGGNVYGERFVVGNGTGSTLTMTSVYGSHSLHSNDANGFRMSSNGSISLAANGGYGIYATGAPLVAQSGFRVDNGRKAEFSGEVNVNANCNASYLYEQWARVATQSWVLQVTNGLVTTTQLNNALRQKESEIVAWANNKFVAK
ncbi:phage tail protein [Bacillus sp. FJAT-49705]|uniref:Phage tail protein n=1 Tax=Cytobacillus citreus TaxID=2833586 RepID=A0ABS5NTR1_9BACI|nr:phage tail protein [Cytobacillus citreus]MBS4191182.1 phage tail protein [Cytobacillus citreus]